jgi:hypothetical protein
LGIEHASRNGKFNLAWPLRWNHGTPEITDRCRGRSGPLYDPVAEFEYYLKTYKFRSLKDEDGP